MNPNLTQKLRKRQIRGAWSVASVVAAGALLVGCQNPEMTKWILPLSGLFGGALVGKYFGGRDGAIGGALAGGAIGLVAGKLIYDKQMDLETRKKVLNASIADAKVVLDQSKAYNTNLQREINRVQAQLDLIDADLVKNRINADQAKQLKAALVPALDTLSQEARQTGQTFETYTRKVESSEKKAQVLKEIQDLNTENAELAKLLQTIAAQRTAASGA